MTGARTPGRTHGAVPAVFVSRSAEIRAARRSRRRTASSPASGAARPAPAVPAAYRVFFCRVQTVSPLAVPAGTRRLPPPKRPGSAGTSRSRRRPASSRHSVRFFRAAPPIPAGVRRLSEPDGSNPPLRVSTGCGVFGEWAGNGCGNEGRTNCVPCVGSAEQKRSATPPGDGRMRPISRSIRFPHPGKSYQSENARQAFLFKQAVFSG